MQKFLLASILLATISMDSGNSLNKMNGFNYESQVGMAERFEDRFCLTIKNGNLAEGEQNRIIILENPQSIAEAIILKKLPNSCSTNPETDAEDSFYSLKLIKGKIELNTVALVIVNYAGKFVSKGGVVSADLNKDRQSEHFRVCTSNEGLHLTVWSGRPLIGKRRWHRYFYLHYDVVPNCKRKDYEGT
jgi:hypothetical protein